LFALASALVISHLDWSKLHQD